jgi:hypothetical protein
LQEIPEVFYGKIKKPTQRRRKSLLTRSRLLSFAREWCPDNPSGGGGWAVG